MKFIVDQGIPAAAIAFLRAAGHDVLHVREAGLNELPDEDILERAIREGRVIVTHDLDFPRLVAQSGGALPSVILFRLRVMRPRRVEAYLRTAFTTYERDLATGAIISIQHGTIRLRRLPIENL
jgi:predicted nuclease of predicted toxin-antitoxin system